MKLPKFSHIGEDIWHIALEGKCRKISKQDEATEAHALMDALDNTPNCPYCLTCSMTCPEKEDGYVEIQMEMRGLKTDDIIDDIIRYLIDRYDLYTCSINLSAWQNLDCTGWVFELANYNFRRSKMADIVTRTCISIDEVHMLMDDVKMCDWADFTTELLTLRLQLEQKRWGGRKEISSTRKFRRKPNEKQTHNRLSGATAPGEQQ